MNSCLKKCDWLSVSIYFCIHLGTELGRAVNYAGSIEPPGCVTQFPMDAVAHLNHYYYLPSPCDVTVAKNAGVFWSKGEVIITGGHFLGNEASDDGGIFFASFNSTTVVEAGRFENNEASRGGVGCVSDGGILQVKGGSVTGNVANNEGGVFAVDEGRNLQVRPK